MSHFTSSGGIRNVTLSVGLALGLIFIGYEAQAIVRRSATDAEKPTGSAAGASEHEASAATRKGILYRNISGSTRFVGSEACLPCHLKIYKDYMRTPHGQAATLPSQRPELRDLPAAGVTICAQDPPHCFRVFKKNGAYYMSEFEPGPDGAELSKQTEKIAFALGQPMVGVGYGIRKGNYLFEAPLSYYAGGQDTHAQGWALSPGYEKDPLGFSRPLLGACMYCHVGRGRVVDDESNLYKDPPIAELKVGCENCHGPGKLHVDGQARHAKISGKIDTSIINPAHLSPRISDDMCSYCHEFGEARVTQLGKKFADFIPGTPLLDTFAIFKSRPLMGWNMMEWSDEMAQSKCYRASGGRLNCTSCHDGHYTPAAQEAPAFYRNKCLACHKENTCRESLEKRNLSNPPDNCASCHMPKHIAPRFVMVGTEGTSHRIVTVEGEPLPEEYRVVPDRATGLILVNKDPASGNVPILPLMLLKAYQSVLVRNPSQEDVKGRYDRLLNQLADSDPDNVQVLSALARRELAKHSSQGYSAALGYLSSSVGKGSRSPEDFMFLAELLLHSGRNLEAIDILKTAVSLFPHLPTAYENLAFAYMSNGEKAAAEDTLKKASGLFPSDPNLRMLQKKLERSQ